MFSKIPSVFKVALPLTLAASPLLLSAAQPPASSTDLDTYGQYCNPASSPASPQSNGDSSGSDRQASSQNSARHVSTQTHALVTSEREMSAFAQNRFVTALRLLRANPYHDSSANSSTGSASSARDNCVAALPGEKPKSETRVALAASQLNAPLFSPAPSISLIAQSPLPDLSNPSAPAPTPPPITPSTRSTPVQPAPSTPVQPAPPVPVQPTVQPSARPLPPVPPAPNANRAPAGFSSENRSSAIDPFNFTPTTLNPTPFDGSIIQTLPTLADGNYRYISGKVEDRPYSDSELRSHSGSVFIFKKVGNIVTGNLISKAGALTTCVTGSASGNVVTGSAYPQDLVQDGAGEANASYGNNALRVSQATRTEGEGVYYARAVLNLSTFSMINAGSSLPPASCQINRTDEIEQG